VLVALVTGAAGQIGTRLVAGFEGAGYVVAGVDVAAGEGILACDITDPEAVRDAVERVLAAHGRLDVLVHNAGVSAIGAFEDHDVHTHARVMAVNYLGPVALTQAALPALRESGGRVVVIGSVAGFAPVLGRPAYVGAKHAVTGLFEALRPELARDGVGVTLVHPTFVTGGMGEAADRAEGRRRSTTGAEITADDVARAVVEAVAAGRDLVLVGRTARLSWHIRRLAPRLYVRLMTRRLGA
jgi:short-subunit dehydrogenase